jgi:hypothetical protein
VGSGVSGLIRTENKSTLAGTRTLPFYDVLFSIGNAALCNPHFTFVLKLYKIYSLPWTAMRSDRFNQHPAPYRGYSSHKELYVQRGVD